MTKKRPQEDAAPHLLRLYAATCQACPSKEICCAKAEARYVTREPHEEAREFNAPHAAIF